MNLKSIQLAGFKSFADTTTIHFPGVLTAIVGPNGCGKSNIVDALRWVIGESSAKQLRGTHLADVIFNGTSHRKPQGQASIELLFDNSAGKFGGEYARYQEIAIRREITRDGQSQFYLNGARCRRRDITDLFLGTGLGPHSYAIIEQGVISKLIEGKPEDIRVYLEEAAGTSKYRERRKETESRIQNTRENLERLSDLRSEIEKQLEHLQQQAASAEKYKTLKQEERLTKAQLHFLQHQALDKKFIEYQQSWDEQTNQVEARNADQRRVELQMEQCRVSQIQANEAFNAVQVNYYQIGADIARQEQHIQHIQTQHHQLTDDLTKITASFQEADQQFEEDKTRIQILTETLASLEQSLAQATQMAQQAATQLQTTEEARSAQLQARDHFQAQVHSVQRQADVKKTQLHHGTQKIQSLAERIAQLTQKASQLNMPQLPAQIDALAAQSMQLKQKMDDVQQGLTQLDQHIQQQKQARRELQPAYETTRKTLQDLLNEKTTLDALQKVALGKHHKETNQWLQDQQWAQKPRLLEGLNVEKGWETAVETVLSPYLEAVCTDQIADFLITADKFTQGRLTLFCIQNHGENLLNPPSDALIPLTGKIQSRFPIDHLLAHIYIAEDAKQAMALLPMLYPQASIITPQGFWFGSTWLRINKVKDETTGVLQRKQALSEIAVVIAEHEKIHSQQEADDAALQTTLSQLEQERERKQQQFRQLSAQHTESHARVSAQQAHWTQLQQQVSAVAQELETLKQQKIAAEVECQSVKIASESAEQALQALEAEKIALFDQKQTLESEYQQIRAEAHRLKQSADESQIRFSKTQNELHFLMQNVQRAEKQLAQLQARKDHMLARQAEAQQPLPELQAVLQQLLVRHIEVEKTLAIHKQKSSHLDDEWRQLETQRHQIEKNLEQLREQIAELRIAQTTVQANRDNQWIQIQETGHAFESLASNIPKEASSDAWQQKLQRIENRVQRLGPINLAAIEEYEKSAARKQYLDSQNHDLTEALTTLEMAIRKIDKESRARLKETFDKANEQFKALFNAMFDGGNAELEWVGDEVLSAGVVIRAQPPGKRNTLLHLLSGGEKALTAIALVFALFQLNPAPFCVLDEVDAPLDEVNVGRFCRLVKTMSSTIQFLFISHNKTTMEMAQQMIGVTMQEPGVSRLVSVDMEQAMAMVR